MNTLLRSALLGASLCGFASAQVVINEVSYDAPGGDALSVFVEIYGPAGTDVGGWILQAYEAGTNTGAGSAAAGEINNENFVFPMGTLIPNDGNGFGCLVVADGDFDGGATLVANADFVDADMDLQNGGDSIVLLDASSIVVDAVGYGNADAAGIGALALNGPAQGQTYFEGMSTRDYFAPLSIQRCPSGTDTDDNLTDFTASAPSPGVAQGQFDCAALQQNNLLGGPFNMASISMGDMIGLETFTSFGFAQPQIMLVSLTDPEVTPPGIPGLPVFDATTGLFLNAVNAQAYTMFFIPSLPTNNIEGNQILFDTTGLPPVIAGLPITFYFGFTILAPGGFIGSTNFAEVTVNP
ncbi:MAG: lamin tail domain-containing protein [Planctomycetota bacterium]